MIHLSVAMPQLVQQVSPASRGEKKALSKSYISKGHTLPRKSKKQRHEFQRRSENQADDFNAADEEEDGSPYDVFLEDLEHFIESHSNQEAESSTYTPLFDESNEVTRINVNFVGEVFEMSNISHVLEILEPSGDV